MDRGRGVSLGVAATLLWLSAALSAGCSNAKELRTAKQANRFLTSVAEGADPDGWRLADDAIPAARQAWRDRNAIRDLGQRLHPDSYDWTCPFVKASVNSRSIGPFTVGDRRAVVQTAKEEGAKPDQIQPMLADVARLPEAELAKAAEAVCG